MCVRSEEHTSELQSRVDISYAVFCLKKTDRAEITAGLLHAEQSHHQLQRRQPLPSRDSSPRRRLPRRRGNPAPGLYVALFFNDTATTEIYTLSLHDALPISRRSVQRRGRGSPPSAGSRSRP